MATQFNTALHPHGQGGRFSTTVGGVQLPASLGRLYQKFGAAGNTMGFDAKANHGTGYGLPNGDARVAYLQRVLNRLGIHDAHGQPLVVDGKLGPLTTQAVKAAQARLGIKQDGRVTPTLMAQLLRMPKPKAVPHSRRARHRMSRSHRRHH